MSKRTYTFESRFGTYELALEPSKYTGNGNFALAAFCIEDGEFTPYAAITVNLGLALPKGFAFVDEPNLPGISEFLINNGLAKPVGVTHSSGFHE